MFKKITALILVFVLVVGVVPSAKAAPETIVDTGDVAIEGTNGFGDLLAQEITENQQESETESKDYIGGYSITDLAIVNNVATVTYDSLEEAILVVALHTEDGMQLITSATVTVTSDATEAVVTFESEMPEYFLASAYLMDPYDYSPLCASYDTSMYTREMQELLASRVDDYDPDKVLNLDDDETTNFAVYADSTIVIEPVEGKNIVASIDNENAAYVIKNADEQMLSLQVGDVFAYAYDENELLIVKVGSIEVNGTTVTIIGAELEMSEAFEAVKIDGIGETEDIVVDDSTAGEGISYVGLVEEDGVNNPNSVEGGDSTTLKHKFEIKIKSKADDGHTSASLAVSGSLDLALDVSVKYYISTSQKYVEFKLSPHLTFSLGVQASLTLSEELGYLAVSPVPGVYVGFEPELQLKLDCKTQFKATLKSVIGFQYDTASGVQNISKKPELDVGIDVEGTIFLGIDFCPQVAIVSDKLSEIEVNMLVGFELEAKASGKAFEVYKKNADEYHECQECIAIDVRVKAKIGGTLKFLDQDWLSVSITIGEWTHKLGEMYYSLDNDEFGIGKCPNRLFRVTVQVEDKEYNPIPGETVTISTLDEALTTDENGLAVFYTTEDEIVVRAEKDGYFSAERVTINKARKIVLCLVYQLDSGDNGGSAGGSEPGNPFEGIDFGGVGDYGTEKRSGNCGENLTWILYKTGVLKIDGSGKMYDYDKAPWYDDRASIKSIVIGENVTSIGCRAFEYCYNLQSVTIPNSVTSIGNSAFGYCYALRDVTLGEGVTQIGSSAFAYCYDLEHILIGDHVEKIYMNAFLNCSSLTEVILPDSVQYLSSPFKNCHSLTRIDIGKGVTSLDEFEGCENLKEINISLENPKYASLDGVLFSKDMSILREYPDGIEGSYSIPNSVVCIYDSAFRYSIIESVTIPYGVTKISSSAFRNCNQLNDVVIPDSVVLIDSFAFYDSDGMESVWIGKGVTEIKSCAFSDCGSLEKIHVSPDNPVYTSDDGVVLDKERTTLLVFPSGVAGHYVIPNDIVEIGEEAFRASRNLESVTFSDSVTIIGDYAFEDCSKLSELLIPDSVTGINIGAFKSCTSLSSIVIPDNVEYVSWYAFENCKNLTSVKIGNGVEYLGHAAFDKCINLVDVSLGNSVVSIDSYTFSECSKLKEINLPDSVTSIRYYAFYYCTGMKQISIPISMETIEEGAFYNCYNLKDVYYAGSQEQWNAVVIESGNSVLEKATIHYNSASDADSMGNVTILKEDAISACFPSGESTELNAFHPGEYGTEIVDKEKIKTASFSNLVPGEQYVMLAMVSVEGADPLAAENLLGIAQDTAGEDGTLSFRYIQRTSYDISYVVVCGASSKNLNDAEISFPEMVAYGELQVVDPVVVYDGVTLTEGRDYVIAGKVDFTEAGEYTCYIRGIHNYAGLVECTYTVAEHEHSFTNYVSDGNATCTEDGTKTAKCEHCDSTDTIPDAGSALGHDMGNWATTVPATCTENGEEQRTCSRCDHSESRVIEAVGHRWDNGIVTREPTEDTEGERLYTCTACGATRTESIPVIGHEHRYEAVVTAPTCTERGYTTYTCKCGESYVADDVAALGHSFGDWSVIQEPTTTEEGLEERSCAQCGHTEQRTIDKLENPFNDVAPGSFYYEPVMWAIENGITNGTSDTTFSPNAQCMRAQVVTFLWRAAGSPEPTKKDNPFVDVKPIDFYYKAVLWAVENGITSGMDATHFGPTAYCNRAQVVTFLYRAMGSPELESMDNPFADVQAGAFYERAVLWAVENGITNGLSATAFGPNSICNRAQIVTFLYRAFVD